MQHEVFRLLHWTSIILFLTLSSIVLWYGGRSKLLSISIGIFTVTILISGLLLAYENHLAFWGTWTWWLKQKIAIWLFLAILVPVISRRIPKLGKVAYIVMIASTVFIFKIVIFKY